MTNASFPHNTLTVLGIKPNSSYAKGDWFTPPADYADPPLPWNLPRTDTPTDPSQALNLTFADAHAADRCTTLTSDALNAYRQAVADWVPVEFEPNGEEDDTLSSDERLAQHDALCGQCEQMIAPHLRFGTDADHYDHDHEPLCFFAPTSQDTSVAYLYTGEDPKKATTEEQAARRWCGCEALPLLVAGRGNPDPVGLMQFEVDKATGTITRGLEELPNQLLPLSDSGRAVAYDGLAYVVASGDVGQVQVFSLNEGHNYQIDCDPDTEEVEGIPIGSTPRGIALLSEEGVGVVALSDGIAVFDLDTFQILGHIDSAELNVAEGERPWDLAVDETESYVFMAIFRNGGSLDTNTVLVTDADALVHPADALVRLDVDGQFVVAEVVTGGSSNPIALELSHDGSMLAVANQGDPSSGIRSSASIIDVASFTRIDVMPGTDSIANFHGKTTYPYFDEASEDSTYATDVAWAPDDSAVYISYIGGSTKGPLAGYGVVRWCPFAKGYCNWEVGVQGAATSVVTLEGMERKGIVVGDSLGNLTFVPEETLESTVVDQNSLYCPDATDCALSPGYCDPMCPASLDDYICYPYTYPWTCIYYDSNPTSSYTFVYPTGSGGCFDDQEHAIPCPATLNARQYIGAILATE